MPPDATMASTINDGEPVTPQELKAWRDERGITQERLAELLESSLGRIRKYEQGERKIPPFMWRALRDLDAELAASPKAPKSRTRRPSSAAGPGGAT